jgi:Polyketide cyclase / dehydrase and lipid transport
MAGKTFSFEVKRTSSAPPATLFRLEADGTRWSEWAKPLRASWDQPGDPPGELGAVRRVGRWPIFVREKTIEYDRDRRHVYELISPPSPAKDYRAEAIFTPTADGGTDFVWRGSFTEGVRGTGPIMRAIFGGAIRLFSAQLVKAAEREHRKGISFPK